MPRFVAPRIGGVLCSNDTLHAVTDQIAGAPSVLFDAVAILPGTHSIADTPSAVDFLSDAFVHCKSVGWTEQASDLMDESGLSDLDDVALCKLDDEDSVRGFVTACRAQSHWPRGGCFHVLIPSRPLRSTSGVAQSNHRQGP